MSYRVYATTTMDLAEHILERIFARLTAFEDQLHSGELSLDQLWGTLAVIVEDSLVHGVNERYTPSDGCTGLIKVQVLTQLGLMPPDLVQSFSPPLTTEPRRLPRVLLPRALKENFHGQDDQRFDQGPGTHDRRDVHYPSPSAFDLPR